MEEIKVKQFKQGDRVIAYDAFNDEEYSILVRKARRNYRCSNFLCRNIIKKGELHGGGFYIHFCLDCCKDGEIR